MDDPNITMEEYIRLEEEKAHRRIGYFNDFDYFKIFEKEFPAIAYNDALISKLDFSEPTVSPQHIYEFDKTSLFEYDGEEQNVIYSNDLFPSNVIYPDDLSDKDNDNDKIDIEQYLVDVSSNHYLP
nr:hypothetical protein [Tanacetum cinerariifolium]